MTRSGPLTRTSVARSTVAGSNSRTPSTSPIRAAYIRATARAEPTPFDEGISAASTSGRFHMSS